MDRKNVTVRILACVAASTFVISLTALPVRADWDPVVDPLTGQIVNHKMHFPQLPDPNGWDVNATQPKVLADDWLCTETGPVANVHLWGSWRSDQPYPISAIRLSIHSDIPDDPANPDDYSRPGDLLWDRVFDPGEWQVRPWGTGVQGWYDPNTGQYVRDDHTATWQYNFVDIKDPFVQERGKVYWLDVSVALPAGVAPVFGWKTSLNHFNDDAVWADVGTAAPNWVDLHDPASGVSLDLAFVITPEPGTVLLLLAGGLALIRRGRGVEA